MVQIKHLDDEFKYTFSLYNSMINDRINIKEVACFYVIKDDYVHLFQSLAFSQSPPTRLHIFKMSVFFLLSIPIIISFLVFCFEKRKRTYSNRLYMKSHTSTKNLFRKRTRGDKEVLWRKTWAFVWVFIWKKKGWFRSRANIKQRRR